MTAADFGRIYELDLSFGQVLAARNDSVRLGSSSLGFGIHGIDREELLRAR